MSTKHLQFFMMPEEFFGIVVADILARLELELVGVIHGTWLRVDTETAHRPLFIAPQETARPSPDDIKPGRDGWLVVNPPRLDGNKLFLAEIASKSDWYDQSANITKDNPDVEKLFRQLVHQIRCRIEFSVIATNEVTHKSHLYKSIGHSGGARRWLKESGQWRQEGVGNVRFELCQEPQ